MSLESIRPSTLDGIKRLARSFKKAEEMRHSAALDRAAVQAGFENYQHANRQLKSANTEAIHRTLTNVLDFYLTAYWRSGVEAGRETLRLQLSKPIDEIISGRQRRKTALHAFRREAPDHLVFSGTLSEQSKARWFVCKAARVLQFCAATMLVPATPPRRLPGTEKLPFCDHGSVWLDRKTDTYITADEPYLGAVENDRGERDRWAHSLGLSIVCSPWRGMHNPDGTTGTQLYLIAPASDDNALSAVVQRLRQAGEPVIESTWGVTMSNRWSSESAPSLPRFRSPLAKQPTKKRAASAQREARGPRNSVPYSMVMARGRRPTGRMPLEAHTEIATALKEVLATSKRRAGVYNRVGAVRSELDDWVQCEYDRRLLPDEQFSDLYYPDHEFRDVGIPTDDGKQQNLRYLERVKLLLLKHYPPSAPLRKIVQRIDGAIESLVAWKTISA